MIIIEGIIMTGMIKIIKGMMVTDTSVGTTITDMEDFEVEVDNLEIGKMDHVGLSSATHD